MSKRMTVGKFDVRVVFKGDNYGLNHILTHKKDDPLVEFYWNPTEQFVSRYYLSTMKNHGSLGLDLHGGVDAWTVKSEDMMKVQDWLNRVT